MLYAIVSDIHGNYNAWAAVLEDIREIGAERIVCLGDVVGYGPEPGRCVQSIRDVAYACILGNHDAVVTKKLDSQAFNDHARKLIEWTELQLNPEEIDYLSQLKYEFSQDCFRCVHGDCYAPEEFNYIVDCEDAKLTWEKTKEDIIFCGHSHLPSIFVLSKNTNETCSLPAQDFSLEEQNRYIVNVGSVGSPRDDDLRASYVLFDSETKSVFFRRIGYNFDEFRARVRFVGLNENDVPLLCYALEEAPAEEVALEDEITLSEIVVSNEASDLAKTVLLHNIDLSSVLKKSTKPKTPKLSPSEFAAAKKQIVIKKIGTPAIEPLKGDKKKEQTSSSTMVLSYKPGVRADKIATTGSSSSDSVSLKKQISAKRDNKDIYSNKNTALGKKLTIGTILGIVLVMLVLVFVSYSPDEVNNLVRYPDANLEVIDTTEKTGTANLLDDIWMSSSDPNTVAPYRITTSEYVNIYFDNIDGMYGSELIFHNIEKYTAPIGFESPFVEIDSKGKYLVLAKVYFDESNSGGDVTMQLVHADKDNLYKVLPSEEVITFHKREIAKSLYKKGDIPKCFEYRPSKAGWWLAKRTIEGKELKQYMRVVIKGRFTGRISIGGISIQRID